MSTQIEITYLDNSGFIVQTARHNLVFDYYQDPLGKVDKLLQDGKQLYVFVSHIHRDHFNPLIATWRDQVAAYFLSSDIAGLARVEQEKMILMAPYEQRSSGEVQVTTYGSTDIGVSFLVEVEGWRIFHAGDLNWWHWQGDHPYNLLLAKDRFDFEMSRLAGLHLDLAFFPVDSRLKDYRAAGVKEFCRRVHVRQLVAMHTRGQRWMPDKNFPGAGKRVSVWCPMLAGEGLAVEKRP